MKVFCFGQGKGLGLLTIGFLISLNACHKPLARHEELSYAKASSEASDALRIESRGYMEDLKADSVVVVESGSSSKGKLSVKYYGINRVAHDTISRIEKVIEAKTDTVWQHDVAVEKNEPGTMDKLKYALAGIGFAMFRLKCAQAKSR